MKLLLVVVAAIALVSANNLAGVGSLGGPSSSYGYGAVPASNSGYYGNSYVAPINCGNGVWNFNSKACNCNYGNYFNQRNQFCVFTPNCGAGVFDSVANVQQCVCNSGNYFNFRSQLCVPTPDCGAGVFDSLSNIQQCVCNSGNYYNFRSQLCVLTPDCGAGVFESRQYVQRCICNAGNLFNSATSLCEAINCGNGSYNTTQGGCVCNTANYFNYRSQLCVLTPDCGAGVFESRQYVQRCICNAGNLFNSATSLCEAINCGNGSYNTTQGGCVCNTANYFNYRSQLCVLTPDCGAGVFDARQYVQRCICNTGNLFNNTTSLCEAINCANGQVNGNRCVCNSGYVLNFAGSCVGSQTGPYNPYNA